METSVISFSSGPARCQGEEPPFMDEVDQEENQRMPQTNTDERVIIIAPVGQDAAVMAASLHAEGFEAHICRSMEEGSQQIRKGAGALLLTEEALESPMISILLDVLQA